MIFHFQHINLFFDIYPISRMPLKKMRNKFLCGSTQKDVNYDDFEVSNDDKVSH